MGAQDAEESSCDAASDSFLPATAVCQQMAGKLAALMASQQECQRSLCALAREQEAFLGDMRSFADSGHLRESKVAAGLRTELVLHSASGLPGEAPARGASTRDWSPSQTVSWRPPSETASEETAGSEHHPVSDGLWMMMKLQSQFKGIRPEKVQRSRVRGSFLTVTESLLGRVRAFCKAILMWRYFETIMGFVILTNAANIGWAIERELKNQDTEVQTLVEMVIVGIFWAELLLVFIVRGIGCYKDLWNCFDFTINMVTTVTLIVVSFTEAEGGGKTFAETMKQMLILRMVRLLRLFRAVRLIQMSKSLWKLLQGLKHCMGTMVSVVGLIFIALFVFACFGAELITKPLATDVEVGDLVALRMSSIPSIMLTLFQFISMDSTADIYTPLVLRSPFLFIYFLLVVVLVTIMLMNLITAVLVEDAITLATMDHDMKRDLMREKLRKLKPVLKELFHRLDSSGDGMVHIPEIIAAIKGELQIPEKISDLVTPTRMLDFFDLFDVDSSGELTEGEFVDGMCCLALSDVPLETMEILHLLRTTRREVMRMSRLAEAKGLKGPARTSAEAATNRTDDDFEVRVHRLEI